MSKALVNEINSQLSALKTKIFVICRPLTDTPYYGGLEKDLIPMTKVSVDSEDWIGKFMTGLTEEQPLLIDYSDKICNLLVKDQKPFYLVYPTNCFVRTELTPELQPEAFKVVAGLDAINTKLVSKIRLHAGTTFHDTLRLALDQQNRESQPAPSSNEDCSAGGGC